MRRVSNTLDKPGRKKKNRKGGTKTSQKDIADNRVTTTKVNLDSLRLPVVSLEDLADHNRDAQEAITSAKGFLLHSIPRLGCGTKQRCCCKRDGTGMGLYCTMMNEAKCPKSRGYHNWAHQNWKLQSLPDACAAPNLKRALSIDASLTMWKKSISAIDYAIKLAPSLHGVPTRCCCRKKQIIDDTELLQDKANHSDTDEFEERPDAEGVLVSATLEAGKEIECDILGGDELVHSRRWGVQALVCPKSSGYHRWSHRSFNLTNKPETCDYGRHVTAPQQFGIAAFVAAVSLRDARLALDPALAEHLEADVGSVRRRLEEAMDKVSEAMNTTREHRTTASTTVSSNRMNKAWLKAELLYGLLNGAVARANRLLTPGAKETGKKDSISSYVPGANYVPMPLDDEDDDHDISGTASPEDDSNFLRSFVMQDLSRLDIRGPAMDPHPFFMETDGSIAERIYYSLDQWLRMALMDSATTNGFANDDLEGLQASMRLHGAWYPEMHLVADKAAAGSTKERWARQWGSLRDSLNFMPWPTTIEPKTLAAPKTCQTGFSYDGTVASFPKFWGFGGNPVTHTFVVFSGEGTGKQGCLETLEALTNKFARMQDYSLKRRERKEARIEYMKQMTIAMDMGCQSVARWGQIGPKIKTMLISSIRSLDHLTFKVNVRRENASEETEISINTTNVGVRRHKSKNRPVSKGVVEAVANWLSHTVIKKALGAQDDDMWKESVLTSLRRKAPFVDSYVLSASYQSELNATGLMTPYDADICDEDADEPKEGCKEWKSSLDGYWPGGSVSGPMFDAIIQAVEAVFEVVSPSDRLLMAQTSATYGAVGFDSPGVLDNSDWSCNETIKTCEVHPQCGRVAAQMLSYPFVSEKEYASTWLKKAGTYWKAGGSFDEDGFHSYCHVPGGAYCWSYTACLEKMMNWLCSQEETADYCCPDKSMAQICAEDVNDEKCNVCVDPPADAKEEDLKLNPPTFTTGGLPSQTLEWLQPNTKDKLEAAAVEKVQQDRANLNTKCMVCKQIRRLSTDKPIWLGVAVIKQCINKEELCGEICGLSEEQPDDFATCRDWQTNCQQLECSEGLAD